MSDTRLLLEITPKGILSFGDETAPIKLSSLNVLIGTNGSGKSNLIDVIGFIRSLADDPMQEIIENGGLLEWAWKGDSSKQLCLNIFGNDLYSSWNHNIIFQTGNDFFFNKEETILDHRLHPEYLIFENKNLRYRILDYLDGEKWEKLNADSLDRQKSVISQIRDPNRYELITRLATIYSGIRIYREWSFGRKNILRNPKPADSRNDYLAEDYSNLGLVLSRSRINPDFKNAILENLRLLYQGLTDFDVLIQGGTTQIFLTEGKFSIPATRLSDGTLRYLCLLAILCDPKPPPLICIEEPELGLHPDILPSLAQLLVTAATRTQLIVTTHSEILIDALTDYPEYVLICEKTDGQTQIKNLDAEKLKIWLKDYRLGQLWMRGQLGGTRW